MSDNTDKKLDLLINTIQKLVDNPAAPVAPVLPLALLSSDDHNLLIRLDSKVDDLKDDIKELKGGTTSKIEDHETRIKRLEISITKLFSYGTALIFIVGIVEFFIAKFWK